MVAPLDAFAAATAARNEHDAVAVPAVQDNPDVRSVGVPTMNCGGATAAATTAPPTGWTTTCTSANTSVSAAAQNLTDFVPILILHYV